MFWFLAKKACLAVLINETRWGQKTAKISDCFALDHKFCIKWKTDWIYLKIFDVQDQSPLDIFHSLVGIQNWVEEARKILTRRRVDQSECFAFFTHLEKREFGPTSSQANEVHWFWFFYMLKIIMLATTFIKGVCPKFDHRILQKSYNTER